MALVTRNIGTPGTILCPNLNSLASSATVGWQSIRIDDTATNALDYEIKVTLSTANTTPANDKAVYVFAAECYYGSGNTWFHAAGGGTSAPPTGVEGSYTLATPHNFRLLGTLNYTTARMVLQDTFHLSNAVGPYLPDGFIIIILNYSGAALSATGNSISIKAIKQTIT